MRRPRGNLAVLHFRQPSGLLVRRPRGNPAVLVRLAKPRALDQSRTAGPPEIIRLELF